MINELSRFDTMARRRNALSTELLLRRLQKHHGVQHYLPAVIPPNPLIAYYKAHLEREFAFKLRHCRTPQQRIQVAACHEFGISNDELMGKSHRPIHFLPRQIAMHLCVVHSKQRCSRIVARLFNKDHTSVLLANRKIPALVASNAMLAQRVARVAVHATRHAQA